MQQEENPIVMVTVVLKSGEPSKSPTRTLTAPVIVAMTPVRISHEYSIATCHHRCSGNNGGGAARRDHLDIMQYCVRELSGKLWLEYQRWLHAAARAWDSRSGMLNFPIEFR